MILQTTNKEGKQLEFNEDMELKHIDYAHNTWFLDLLEMVDKLRVALADALDVLDENDLLANDPQLLESNKLEKEVIELLTNICKE